MLPSTVGFRSHRCAVVCWVYPDTRQHASTIFSAIQTSREPVLKEQQMFCFIKDFDEKTIRRDDAEDLTMALANVKVILGSASEARQSILREMGYEFTVITAAIDEKAIRRDNAEDLVMALADAKAEAIKAKPDCLKYNEECSETVLLITADQVVVHEGIIKEKPATDEEARQFIKGYSRAPACTIGSVLVTNLKTGKKKGRWDKAEVYFHPIPDDIVESLIKEGLVFRAAGGLLVEHPLTSPFVEAVVGTIDSVMGLPKDLTKFLIADVL